MAINKENIIVFKVIVETRKIEIIKLPPESAKAKTLNAILAFN